METPSPQILVIGSSNLDQIVSVRQLPAPGETVTDAVYAEAFGGKGANQAVAAARAGARVCFVTCLGRDSWGNQMEENLKANGVDVSFVRRVEDQASGIAQIWVDAQGQNSIAVALGANQSLSPSDVNGALQQDLPFSAALLQLEMPVETAVYAIEACYQKKIPVFLNLAPFHLLPEAVFSRLTCLILNEIETSSLLGKEYVNRDSAGSAASELALRYQIPQVIITLGAHGMVWSTGNQTLHLPAPVVKAVDTTAAGDVFCGYLAEGYAQCLDWPENLARSLAAASLSVTRKGAQPSIPRHSEVENFRTTARP